MKGLKLTDAANGRRILDCIDNAMQKCGLSLVAAVKSGFNLESAAAAKQSENGELDSEIQDLVLLEIMVHVKPEKDYYEAEAKDQLRMAKSELQRLQDSLRENDPNKFTESEILEKHAELKEIAKELGENNYFNELRKYKNKVEEQNTSKTTLSGLRKRQQKNNVMDAVFQSLIAAKTAIAKKVKGAVKEYPLLIEKMNERIAGHGMLIKDSYNNDNLTGMYMILKSTYGKATLISVNRWLMDSMSMSVTYDTLKEKPEQGLNVVLECLKEEEQIKLWEYMTKDMFFTALLLRIYQPNQSLYIDIAQEAMRYLHLQEQDQFVNEELTVEERAMPVFSHLNNHIKEVLVKTKEFAKRNERTTRPVVNGNLDTNSGNSFAGNSGKQKQYQKGMEIAASATDSSTEQQNKLRMVDNMTFNKEIIRNDMLGYKHRNGTIFVYTATKDACKKCMSKNRHESPACYTRTCRRCGLFGHTEPYCKQVISEAHVADIELEEEEEDPV